MKRGRCDDGGVYGRFCRRQSVGGECVAMREGGERGGHELDGAER